MTQPQKNVRVRIPVVVSVDGFYVSKAASGDDDETNRSEALELASDAWSQEPRVVFWLEAVLPVPVDRTVVLPEALEDPIPEQS